jgi:hypothetical protein
VLPLKNHQLWQILASSQWDLRRLVKTCLFAIQNQFQILSEISSLLSNKYRYLISELIFRESIKFWSQPIAFDPMWKVFKQAKKEQILLPEVLTNPFCPNYFFKLLKRFSHCSRTKQDILFLSPYSERAQNTESY